VPPADPGGRRVPGAGALADRAAAGMGRFSGGEQPNRRAALGLARRTVDAPARTDRRHAPALAGSGPRCRTLSARGRRPGRTEPGLLASGSCTDPARPRLSASLVAELFGRVPDRRAGAR